MMQPAAPRRGRQSWGLLRALEHRNYRLLFAGQSISLLGMWLQLTAQSWLMWRLTDAATAVGLLAVAQHAPSLVLGPFAGALADRYDRRRILVWAQLVTVVPATLLGVLTVTDMVEPWHVVALTLVTGLVRAFEIPARHAFVPDIVDREDLPNAIALNSMLFNGARVAGPTLAGVIIAAFGEGWCFIANGLSYLPLTTALLAMSVIPRRLPPHEGRSLLREVRDGLHYILHQPTVRALMGALAVAALFGSPYSVLLPSLSERVLAGDERTFGFLTGAIGVGAIIGALALSIRSAGVRATEGLERWVIGAALLYGLGLIALASSTTFGPAAAALVLAGAGFMVQMAGTSTLIQLVVPDELRGRVMALHSTLFLGMLPVGGLVAGALADRVGESMVIGLGGLVTVCGGLAFGGVLLRRAIRV